MIKSEKETKEKLHSRKCRVEGCERLPNPCRVRKRDYICSFHNYEREKQRRPVIRARLTLKHNAQLRNHTMNISRRHWYYLNYFTLYWKNKGCSSDSLTIDRMDNAKEY